MRTVVVLQARVDSSRLPGKVLLDLAGKPMLARQIERLQTCVNIDDIVVATTTAEADTPLEHLADSCGVRWYRGESDDVLRRCFNAGLDAAADVVVRVTGDCPLIDPGVTDRVIAELIERRDACDYASNVIRRTYPRGLDTEAMYFDTLERMDRLATSKAAREHVTVYLRSEQPQLFLTHDVCDSADHSDLRWTVDDMADLALVRAIYEQLHLASQRVDYPALLAYVRSHPELTQMNAGGYTWSPPTQGEH